MLVILTRRFRYHQGLPTHAATRQNLTVAARFVVPIATFCRASMFGCCKKKAGNHNQQTRVPARQATFDDTRISQTAASSRSFTTELLDG